MCAGCVGHRKDPWVPRTRTWQKSELIKGPFPSLPLHFSIIICIINNCITLKVQHDSRSSRTHIETRTLFLPFIVLFFALFFALFFGEGIETEKNVSNAWAIDSLIERLISAHFLCLSFWMHSQGHRLMFFDIFMHSTPFIPFSHAVARSSTASLFTLWLLFSSSWKDPVPSERCVREKEGASNVQKEQSDVLSVEREKRVMNF